MTLDQEFTQRMRDTCEESIRLGYTPIRMIGMLSHSSGVTIAKKMVKSGDIQEGLLSLSAIGRRDLSIESIMLEPKFRGLFTKQELDAAKWRLTQC